jgi:2-oxo-3-hexenedioate decarboxylase
MSVTLSATDIDRLRQRVEAAQTTATAIPKLTNDYPGMTMDDGYAVQMALRKSYLSQGRQQIGWKAGLTSKAKMAQMGVDVPSIGFLLRDMARPENTAISVTGLVHPRVECEVAFVLAKDLAGPDVTREDVLDATDHVLPAIEIIDSRFSGFKFDLESVVADNGSSALYVGGGRPRKPRAMGASAAVLGHPADAVAMTAKILHGLGETLPAGSLILSGGITEALAVKPGDHVIARFQDLGDVSIRFTE